MARWAREEWRTLGLVSVSAWLSYTAVALWIARATQTFFPVVWPAWFMVAAVLTLAYACRPASEQLYRYSGAFVVIALASRVPAIITNMLVGAYDELDVMRV